MNGHTDDDQRASVEHVFDQFVHACTCKAILSSFQQLLDLTGLRHAEHSQFYGLLKDKLKGSWKAQALWTKIDKRAAHKDYKRGTACKDIKVLVIGAGPCGLRTAIECALLGAKTVLVEKRDRFSRNNVLHLWPYLITDLRNLGAKKFFGKFCSGAIDHISIRQLQCILMKVALLLGVEVHVNVSFDGLLEPPEDQSTGIGWRCRVTPPDHALSEYIFDVLIGADGKRNTLPGFTRKEFRGKLAIAITANFINRNSSAESRVEEISGVAFIFNQKFFLDLRAQTRIDLENIVYYKDDTHYFVMTVKKASLLEKGVLKEDYNDTISLLDRANINQEALLALAKEAANFSTHYQMPHLEYAVNHYGTPDVAMFDFTSMFAAENASRFLLKNGHHLLMGLVGDSLLEPFWPTGSGCARGFLGAFDAAWMIRSWAMGKSPQQVLAERESVFTVLSQTTPQYLHKNFNQYSIDPNSRYPNLNVRCVKPFQVRHLYEGGKHEEEEEEEEVAVVPSKRARNVDSTIDSYSLLRWCQRVLNTGAHRGVHVVDFTSSWRSGLALCALMHSFRPEIIDPNSLMECDTIVNNRLAFSTAERELGIPPVLTPEDMARYELPDKLTMISYLAQFYHMFKMQDLPSSIPPPVKAKRKSTAKEPKSPRSPNRRVSFLQKLSAKIAKSKKRKESEETEERSLLTTKKLKERQDRRDQAQKGEVELTRYSKLPMDEISSRLQLDRNTEVPKPTGKKGPEEMLGAVSVTAMADLLVSKFKSNQSQPIPETQRFKKGTQLLAATAASEFCCFCHKKVYIVERWSAEGEFFHRSCFRCDHCDVGLRLNNYTAERDVKPVKFYCYRHALPELRLRRKRGFEEDVKENIPQTVITPAPDDDVLDGGQASRHKSPRKAAPGHLTPLTLPKDVTSRPKKTPERVEFEISFDGQEEESEEEQFEHNLRASMSSDTLLDDEEEEEDDDDTSDSDLSVSDLESGAEDEVWENAPGTPLTLQEAKELVGTWRRTHSQENLLVDDAPSKTRTVSSGSGYTRLKRQDAGDEGSSTEVDERDSESYTDTSDTDDGTEPSSHTSGPPTTHTPSTPTARLSASKASFFAGPQRVVELDPFDLFGRKGKDATKNQTSEEAELDASNNNNNDDDDDGDDDDDDGSLHGLRGGELEGEVSKDRSKTVIGHDNEEVRKDRTNTIINQDYGEFSKDNYVDDGFVPASMSNKVEDEETIKDRSNTITPNHHQPSASLAQAESVDEYEDDQEDEEKGDDGDDEKCDDDDDDDDDEEGEEEGGDEGNMDKRKVSLAMEQLLMDIDHKKDPLKERGVNDTSDSGDNEPPPIIGRLSPSALKTRKFRMKRTTAAVKSKERRRSSILMTTSESEAGRPTTSDTSRPESSTSRSPSADLDSRSTSADLESRSSSVDIEDRGSRDKTPDLDVPESSSRKVGTDRPKDQKMSMAVLLGKKTDSKDSLDKQISEDFSPPSTSTLKKSEKMSVGERLLRLKGLNIITTSEDPLNKSPITTPPEEKPLGIGETVDASKSPAITPTQETKSIVSSTSSLERSGSVTKSRVSANKANFFSEPPKVVRIDPSTLADPEVSDLGTMTLNTDDSVNLQKVLEDMLVMPELSESSDLDDLVYNNVDDRFVTERRGKKIMKKKSGPSGKTKVLKSKKPPRIIKSLGSPTQKIPPSVKKDPFAKKAEEEEFNSSFSISTPSDSDTSLGDFPDDPDLPDIEDNAKPDPDMLRDYHTTMSLALGESWSDSEDKPAGDATTPQTTPVRADQSKAESLDASSLYVTPDTSVTAPPPTSGSSPVRRGATRRPLPRPRSGIDGSLATSSVTSQPPTPPSVSSDLSLSVDTPYCDPRDSSGSDIFVSPVESFPQPPLLITSSDQLPSPPVTQTLILKPSSFTAEPDESWQPSKAPRKLPSLPTLSAPPGGKPTDAPTMCSSPKPAQRTSVGVKRTMPVAESPKISRALPTPTVVNNTKPSMTKSIPVSKSQNTRISDSKKGASITAKSSVAKSIPGPKLASSSISNSKQTSVVNRLSDSKQTAVTKPSLAKSISGSKSANPSTSDSKSQAPKPLLTKSISGPKSANPRMSDVKQSVVSKPPTVKHLDKKPPLAKISLPKPSPALTKTPSSPSPSSFQSAITPPVFKPPGKKIEKKTISIDRAKLEMSMSVDESVGKKKKIIPIENLLDDEIPFADESESEEKFYTPFDPSKFDKPDFAGAGHANAPARKRILPSPPEGGSNPAVSSDQTRGVHNAEREKAKQEARERARLKSDEELGLSTPPSTPTKIRPRIPSDKENDRDYRSSSYDTPTASDVVSDSDRVFSHPSSATDDALESKHDGKKGKKKVKTPKTPKDKKRKSDNSKERDSEDSEKKAKDKRKSLLSLILPNRSPDKGSKHVSDSDNTPKGSDLDVPKHKKRIKAPKGLRKKDKKAKDRGSSVEDLDVTPTHHDPHDPHDPRQQEAPTRDLRDLAICSVFHTEASTRPAPLGVKRSLPVAPRASGEDFSDSDESHMSISTMHRRREEDLDERVARRLKRIQAKQQRQAEQKRLRMAQEIQRQLEEVEVRQRELEERGIQVEKALRGDTLIDEDVDESQLMSEWFTLVHEKNALLRYESELNVRAKELELEDRQSRLELDFRDRSRLPERSRTRVREPKKHTKTDQEIVAEGHLLEELLDVVEQRNTLVALLEEDRVREQKEDDDLKSIMTQKGFVLSPMSYDTRRERQKIEAP